MSKIFYERIYKLLENIYGDLNNLPSYLKLKSEGFMDLNMDKLYRESESNSITIALSHYYKHPSGDMIPDPDMEIRIYPDRKIAEALSYQDAYTYKVVYDENDQKVYPGNKKELNIFLLIWLENLKKQGFKAGGVHA